MQILKKKTALENDAILVDLTNRTIECMGFLLHKCFKLESPVKGWKGNLTELTVKHVMYAGAKKLNLTFMMPYKIKISI